MSYRIVWPSVLLVMILSSEILLFQCDSGFIIGGCEVVRAFLDSFVFISLVCYVILVLIMKIVISRFHRAGKWMYIALGPLSLIISGIIVYFDPMFLLYPLKLRGF
ncbi:hypothetical protein A2875_00045 [Candidatus Gottesmanbacteria bacterium RIFCSPHIGHO2_01_FULL_46_14]|uniref:Uncharacterized protein n=2 Tax=Candidatus Gottesmaniibacteriota TaxID=1752720 RepID=A0A1F5ZQP1_9BACT|nr:MAG: hypothetical protein A2875_00045 [Candidatus Gottesmanbacteria bacterium RIFCSPHIGHO2_01_FULL_46_14]OGG28712.1 MAG: hypothetical protein A2971_00080 [Candidatus Gottesmanbacteria bacterium RIFCSPLOWO2_01_FULL_46_21]